MSYAALCACQPCYQPIKINKIFFENIIEKQMNLILPGFSLQMADENEMM